MDESKIQGLERKLRFLEFNEIEKLSGEEIREFYLHELEWLINLPLDAGAFHRGEGVGGHSPAEINQKINAILNLSYILLSLETDKKVRELYEVIINSQNKKFEEENYKAFYNALKDRGLIFWGDKVDSERGPFQIFQNSILGLHVLIRDGKIPEYGKHHDKNNPTYS